MRKKVKGWRFLLVEGADSLIGEIDGEQHLQIFKGEGNDVIHGGGGIDYALYSGLRRISPTNLRLRVN